MENYNENMSSNNKYTNQDWNIIDYGPSPIIINLYDATLQNKNFRSTLWTGDHLQLTLMSIPVGEDIGLESHPDNDQYLRVEQGEGLVRMGYDPKYVDFEHPIYEDYAFIIPAGTWHNIINTGNVPLKLHSIYSPTHHPRGTTHQTKADAEAAEHSSTI